MIKRKPRRKPSPKVLADRLWNLTYKMADLSMQLHEMGLHNYSRSIDAAACELSDAAIHIQIKLEKLQEQK